MDNTGPNQLMNSWHEGGFVIIMCIIYNTVNLS